MWSARCWFGDPTGPARVTAQVVTGVWLPLRRRVLHQGVSVNRINTAATVWCASGVGVLAGLGLIGWAALARRDGRREV